MTASPGATYTYNGAQQMTSSTKDGVTTRYTYAGTDQNQLLTETTDGAGSYGYIYGGADSQGVPIIVGQSTAGAGTSSVISDPVTGQPLDLTTADGVTGLYVVNGIGNQVGLLTDTRTTAFRVTYSPYGTQNVTAGATSDEWVQNPYGFKNGNRTDNGAIVKFGLRWYLATTGTWTQRDTLDAPLDPKNANRYGYAGGEPINGSDPTGRSVAGAAANGVFAAIGVGLAAAACISATLGGCAVAAVVVGAAAGAGGGIAQAQVEGRGPSGTRSAAAEGAISGGIGGLGGGLGRGVYGIGKPTVSSPRDVLSPQRRCRPLGHHLRAPESTRLAIF
jgi:RHS repeat-associated protein